MGGLPVRESAIAEAQDTHFLLELFEMMSRRVNAVLALGTTDHVLPSPTRVICQKRNFPTLFVGTKFSSPFAFATPLYSILLIDWRRAIGDVFSNPLTDSVNGFLHSATAALTFQFTVPTGWYRRGAISAPFSMGAAGISGAPLLSPGCYCTRRIA